MLTVSSNCSKSLEAIGNFIKEVEKIGGMMLDGWNQDEKRMVGEEE